MRPHQVGTHDLRTLKHWITLTAGSFRSKQTPRMRPHKVGTANAPK
ncbi:hypothetical protein AB4865_02055 [Capnocytophaga sp. ARDL2]